MVVRDNWPLKSYYWLGICWFQFLQVRFFFCEHKLSVTKQEDNRKKTGHTFDFKSTKSWHVQTIRKSNSTERGWRYFGKRRPVSYTHLQWNLDIMLFWGLAKKHFMLRVALYKGPKFNYLICWDREKWALHQGSHYITGALYRDSTVILYKITC